MKTVQDLQAFLRSLASVPDDSVDQIIIGNPDTEIAKIGFCWMPYFETIRDAHQQGINVLVVHEPTFYNHHDLSPGPKEFMPDHHQGAGAASAQAYQAMIREKAAWIEERHMAIIRCHDVLDVLEGDGIPFSFGRFLGFSREDLIRQEPFYHVYRLPNMPAIEAAGYLASKMKAAGQPGLAFYGDPQRPVSSLAIGTGCYSDPLVMMDLEADMYVSLNDVVRTWVQCCYSADSGLPLVVIDHGTSEDAGMQALCRLVQDKTALPCIWIPQGCTYRFVSGE